MAVLVEVFELRRWRQNSISVEVGGAAEFTYDPSTQPLRNQHASPGPHAAKYQEYREEVERQETDFSAALTIAEIYLDKKTSDLMHAVLGSVRQMSTSVWLRTPDVFESYGKHQAADVREPDWRLFTTTFDAAHGRMGDLLHPKELMTWIDDGP